jgi:hypothetical protein
MRDIFEVLRQKELELARVRREVDALRLILPLIEEEKDGRSRTEKLEEPNLSAR